jgi:hypothetical protein
MKKYTVLAALFLAFFAYSTPVHAEEMQSRAERVTEKRASQKQRKTVSQVRDNPCIGLYGSPMTACLRSQKKESDRHVVRPIVKHRETKGRRLAAIRARRERQRSAIVNRLTLKTVNLKPGMHSAARRTLQNAILNIELKPIFPHRAKAGNRKTGRRPVCTRHGQEQIRCLLEVGIPINEQNADKGTLRAWEIYKKENGLEE